MCPRNGARRSIRRRSRGSPAASSNPVRKPRSWCARMASASSSSKACTGSKPAAPSARRRSRATWCRRGATEDRRTGQGTPASALAARRLYVIEMAHRLDLREIAGDELVPDVAAEAQVRDEHAVGEAIGPFLGGTDGCVDARNHHRPAVETARHERTVIEPDLAVMEVGAVPRVKRPIEQHRQPDRFGDVLAGVGERRRRQHDADAEARAGRKTRRAPPRHDAEELAPGGLLERVEQHEARIGEARRELERPDALRVHDGIEVEIADMAVPGEKRREPAERALEESPAALVCDDRAHLAGELALVAGEEALMLPVEARRMEEARAVEIGADAHLDARHMLHQDEARRSLAAAELRGEDGAHVAPVGE